MKTHLGCNTNAWSVKSIIESFFELGKLFYGIMLLNSIGYSNCICIQKQQIYGLLEVNFACIRRKLFIRRKFSSLIFELALPLVLLYCVLKVITLNCPNAIFKLICVQIFVLSLSNSYCRFWFSVLLNQDKAPAF